MVTVVMTVTMTTVKMNDGHDGDSDGDDDDGHDDGDTVDGHDDGDDADDGDDEDGDGTWPLGLLAVCVWSEGHGLAVPVARSRDRFWSRALAALRAGLHHL